MAQEKQRSVFWVVSTHVLTTGFAMPAVAGMIAMGVVLGTDLRPLPAFLVVVGLQTLGYIGGAFYSLSYIRDVALIEKPSACITPSIVTFLVLAGLGLALNIAMLLHPPRLVSPILGLSVLLVSYAIICFAFAAITRRGFSRMEAVPPRGPASA